MGIELYSTADGRLSITQFACGADGKACPKCGETVKRGYQLTLNHAGIASTWYCRACLYSIAGYICAHMSAEVDA